jgi:hypothetical protein
MAEIRVEQKRRSLAWLWLLLALVVIGLVVWYLNNDGINQVDTVPASSAIAAPATQVAVMLPSRAPILG